MPRTELPRFAWERAIISRRGPANPTTRHVLLTLAIHLDKRGEAWPSIRTLAAESGLSERAVFTHIEIAAGEGWIRKATVKDESRGQAWRRNVYTITVPAPEAVAPRSTPYPKGHAPSSTPCSSEGVAPDAEGHAPGAEGVERSGNKVMHHVHTNNVLNTSVNSSMNTAGEKDRKPGTLQTPSAGGPNRRTLSQWATSLNLSQRALETDPQFERRILNEVKLQARAGHAGAKAWLALQGPH